MFHYAGPFPGGTCAKKVDPHRGGPPNLLRYGPCAGHVATGRPPYFPPQRAQTVQLSALRRLCLRPRVGHMPALAFASVVALGSRPGRGSATPCPKGRNMEIKVFYPGGGSPTNVFPARALIRPIASTLLSQPCHNSLPLMLGRSRLTCTMGSVALKFVPVCLPTLPIKNFDFQRLLLLLAVLHSMLPLLV